MWAGGSSGNWHSKGYGCNKSVSGYTLLLSLKAGSQYDTAQCIVLLVLTQRDARIDLDSIFALGSCV